MRVPIDDFTIDKVLSEHQGEEQLSKVLGRLNITAPPNTNWPWDLKETGLFELYGAPDYLKITPFGKMLRVLEVGLSIVTLMSHFLKE